MVTDCEICAICGTPLREVVDVEMTEVGPACTACVSWRQISRAADRRQQEAIFWLLFRHLTADRSNSLQTAA